MVKGLYFSRVFTSYLYYAICISKHEYERLSKLLRITKWLSQLDCCGLRIYLVIQAHVAPDVCVVTCSYQLHSEIISRSHLLIQQEWQWVVNSTILLRQDQVVNRRLTLKQTQMHPGIQEPSERTKRWRDNPYLWIIPADIDCSKFYLWIVPVNVLMSSGHCH